MGAGLFLWLALPKRSLLTTCLMAVGAAVMFLAIDYAYIRDPVFDLVTYQFNFFLHPNDSLVYQDARAALAANPQLLILAGAALAMAAISKEWRRFFATALWIAIYYHVLKRRPHSTSIASAELSMFFLIAIQARSRLSVAAATAAIAAICVLVWPTPLFVMQGYMGTVRDTPPQDFPPKAGIMFIPSNYWNAGLTVQALTYNGQIGLYPIGLGPDGRVHYITGGRVMGIFFPGLSLQAMTNIHSASSRPECGPGRSSGGPVAINLVIPGMLQTADCLTYLSGPAQPYRNCALISMDRGSGSAEPPFVSHRIHDREGAYPAIGCGTALRHAYRMPPGRLTSVTTRPS